jgi:hypothetical protein
METNFCRHSSGDGGEIDQVEKGLAASAIYRFGLNDKTRSRLNDGLMVRVYGMTPPWTRSGVKCDGISVNQMRSHSYSICRKSSD